MYPGQVGGSSLNLFSVCSRIDLLSPERIKRPFGPNILPSLNASLYSPPFKNRIFFRCKMFTKLSEFVSTAQKEDTEHRNSLLVGKLTLVVLQSNWEGSKAYCAGRNQNQSEVDQINIWCPPPQTPAFKQLSLGNDQKGLLHWVPMFSDSYGTQIWSRTLLAHLTYTFRTLHDHWKVQDITWDS